MKRERLLYLDMIKFFAVICVFVCHFTRTLEYYGISFSFKILPDELFSLYTGYVGVTLFFIASGAALMYVYDKECILKTYYKKRFMGIYPMLWITFIFAFCIQFFQYKGYDYTIPKYNIIYSVLGFDALVFAANITKTFYVVGEWFLGVIIILYIIFPLLRKCVLKYPWVFLMLAFTGGGYTITYILM